MEGVTDSKKLTPKKRDLLFDRIVAHAAGVATGVADVHEIDALNILQAALLSMKRAVESLDPPPDCLLIDGKFTIDHAAPQTAVIKGDAPQHLHCRSLHHCQGHPGPDSWHSSMSSIPRYGFDRHKGYPTAAHRVCVAEVGPLPGPSQDLPGGS